MFANRIETVGLSRDADATFHQIVQSGELLQRTIRIHSLSVVSLVKCGLRTEFPAPAFLFLYFIHYMFSAPALKCGLRTGLTSGKCGLRTGLTSLGV